MTTISIRTSGLERDSQGHFLCKCPACKRVNLVIYDPALDELERRVCAHFVDWREERGIGIFFRFTA